ncbi:hypothetical protein Efla_004544 [Eimeria flavescens]
MFFKPRCLLFAAAHFEGDALKSFQPFKTPLLAAPLVRGSIRSFAASADLRDSAASAVCCVRGLHSKAVAHLLPSSLAAKACRHGHLDDSGTALNSPQEQNRRHGLWNAVAAVAASAAAAVAAAAYLGHCKQQRRLRCSREAARLPHFTSSFESRPHHMIGEDASRVIQAPPFCFLAAAAAAAPPNGVYVISREVPLSPSAAAACQERKGPSPQQQVHEQQVSVRRALEALKPAVVQVYAVLPVRPTPARIASYVALNQKPEALQEQQTFRFLGSGFFFDDRAKRSEKATKILEFACSVSSLQPPNEEQAAAGDATTQGASPAEAALPTFRLAVKDSQGRLLAASLCGIDGGATKEACSTKSHSSSLLLDCETGARLSAPVPDAVSCLLAALRPPLAGVYAHCSNGRRSSSAGAALLSTRSGFLARKWVGRLEEVVFFSRLPMTAGGALASTPLPCRLLRVLLLFTEFGKSPPTMGEAVVTYAAAEVRLGHFAGWTAGACSTSLMQAAYAKEALICLTDRSGLVVFLCMQHADEPIGASGVVLQPRQTFKSLSDSGGWGFLHLQLLTLPGGSGEKLPQAMGSKASQWKLEGTKLAVPAWRLSWRFGIRRLGARTPRFVLHLLLHPRRQLLRLLTGMSGAPVCTLDGRVRVAEALRDGGAFAPPSVGLLVEEVPPNFATTSDEKSAAAGVRVCAVTPGSAAAEAGVRAGDRILSVMGEEMKSVGQLREAILLQKGGPFELQVERAGRTMRFKVNV